MSKQICQDLMNLGHCTKGLDCMACSNLSQFSNSIDPNNLNMNVNAKLYVPKNKQIQTTDTNIDTNKLNFNLEAKAYMPKFGNQQGLLEEDNLDQNQEEEDDYDGAEFDMIMKDIINNEVMEELEDDESDEERWFPKYKDCECCKGFVYKCKGKACESLGACFCKMKEECDDEEEM